MKKILSLIATVLMAVSASAITSVDDICGNWKASGTYKFAYNYNTSDMRDNPIVEGQCIITKTGDNTVSIQNLLGDDNTTMTGTVDLSANTITVQSSTDIWSYYTMCASDGKSAPVLTISSDGTTISITGATFAYYGTVYGTDCNLTLSDHQGSTPTPTPEEEATLLWSCKGKAWTPGGALIGNITMNAYSDGTYAVKNWMGTEGYDLKFKVVPDAQWTSLISIQNAYSSNAGYDYVNAGTLKNSDPICYAGIYTAYGYSAAYNPDYTKPVTELQQEGGYINMYTYAYDSEDKNVFAGYYSVTWGPEYSISINPFHNNYMEKGQAQDSHLTAMNQSDFTGTLKIYSDSTYIIKAWEGVEGYDLKFKLAGHDSITVLNSDATEVITKSGNRYWRVPTGRTDYDRACIYENSPAYNTFDINAERAYITFGCSYIYPVDSNNGKKAYYSVRGFNADTVKTMSMRECVWSNAQSAWVDTVCFNRNNIDSVKVYTLTTTTDSTYYCIPDFLGPMTGDLVFSLKGDTIAYNKLLCMVDNAGFYYYLHEGNTNASAYDTAYLNYFYSSDADFAHDGSLIFDIWYKSSTMPKGLYTYYCLNLDKASDSVYGDVTGNGTVGYEDIEAIVDVICGGEANSKADVNGDGKVNVLDVEAVITTILANK